MKRTGKKLVMLMTVLFLLIMGSGATIAWGSVTLPTKGTQYTYNFETKKWVKTKTTFTASYTSSGKLKKRTFDYGSDKSTVTYTWKGDYLKKVKTSITGSKPTTRTYTYKNGKLMKVKSDSYTTTYKWKGKKGTATEKSDSDVYKFNLTLKNGRMATQSSDEYKYKYTYSYYQRGLRKSYTFKSGSYKEKVTYGRNGFLKKVIDGSAMSTTYSWKKNEVIITTKENGKVIGKTKWKFSKTKRVSRAWNCDAFGVSVNLF